MPDRTDHNLPQVFDNISRNQRVIQHEHNKMHLGNHYFLKSFGNFTGVGTVFYLRITTPPAATARIHFRANFSAESEYQIGIFEDATLSAAGAAIIPFNNDRNSSNTSTVTLTQSPTVTNDGSIIWSSVIGSMKNSNFTANANYEILLKSDSTHLIKFTKILASTHWLDFDIFWYEVV